MNLQELLTLEAHTLADLEQMECLLRAELDAKQKERISIEEEDRSLTLARVSGIDKGSDKRRAALEKIGRDRADLAHVLADVLAKIAIEKARQAEEVEAEAWDATWKALARRRKAFHKIGELIDQIGALHGAMKEAYHEACTTAPKKSEVRTYLLPGHNDTDKAIVVALNTAVGYPLALAELGPLEMRLRVHGLVNHLNETEDAVMCSPVLNRDAACGI